MDQNEWNKVQQAARDRAARDGQRQQVTVNDGPNGGKATIRPTKAK